MLWSTIRPLSFVNALRAVRRINGAAAVAETLRVVVAAAGVLLAVPTLRAQNRAAARDDRPTVAIMYFTNGSLLRHAEYEPLSKGIADMLITDLARNDGVRVVERDQLQRVLNELRLNTTDRVDPATAVRVGKLLGAHHMIFGGFVIDPKGRMRLNARAVHVETSRVEYVESVERKADDVLDLIGEMGRKLNDGLHLPRLTSPSTEIKPPREQSGQPRPDTGGRPSHSDAGYRFRALMLYSRALTEEDSGHRTQAVALYRSALDEFPGYEAARARLRRLAQTS